MQDVQKQVALNLPVPANIHFFKHHANIYTIQNQDSDESGTHLFTTNLHIPRTCLSELPRNIATKSILMRDCESSLCYFNPHYSSLLFLELAKFCHLFQRDQITYLLLKLSCSAISNKGCNFNFMLASSDSELEIWTWKILHCLGDP